MNRASGWAVGWADLLVGHQAISTVKPTDSQVLDKRGIHAPTDQRCACWCYSVISNQQAFGSTPAGSFIKSIHLETARQRPTHVLPTQTSDSLQGRRSAAMRRSVFDFAGCNRRSLFPSFLGKQPRHPTRSEPRREDQAQRRARTLPGEYSTRNQCRDNAAGMALAHAHNDGGGAAVGGDRGALSWRNCSLRIFS